MSAATGETQMMHDHKGFDGAEATPGIHDNYLKAASAGIVEAFGKAKVASKVTLEILKGIGETLNECRDTLGSAKAFNEWAEAQSFPFATAWRKRLMQLAANWADIMEAVDAAPEEKRKWSVDGVIGIWNATKAKPETDGTDGGDAGEGEGGEGAGPKAKPETKAEKLERMLREALERIAALEAENATLKSGPKGKAKQEQEAPKQEQKRGPYTGPKMDAATVARARKVHGLWKRPGTEGEGEAAKGRLEDMAQKRGMSLDDFLAACGLAA